MELYQGTAQPAGTVSLARSVDLGDLALRRASLGWRLRNFLTYRRKTVGQVAAASFAGRVFGFAPVTAALSGVHYRPDWSSLAPEMALKLKVLVQARVDLTAQQIDALLGDLGGFIDIRQLPRYFGGELTDYGILSRRLVTTVGVQYLVDALQNLVEPENLKFHGFGTGATAENIADTALVTELTTQYAVDNTRPTGSLTEGASANIFRSVGTLSPDTGGTIAITEHGLFSASSSTVLLDRSVFSAVNLVAASDSLQATYDLTIAAGG